MILIYIVCANKKEALKIGKHLVEKRFGACANIFPIDSFYRWRGKLVKDKETVIIFKTIKKNFDKVAREVKKLHSYKVPAIFSLEVSKATNDYLKWLKKETR